MYLSQPISCDRGGELARPARKWAPGKTNFRYAWSLTTRIHGLKEISSRIVATSRSEGPLAGSSVREGRGARALPTFEH